MAEKNELFISNTFDKSIKIEELDNSDSCSIVSDIEIALLKDSIVSYSPLIMELEKSFNELKKTIKLENNTDINENILLQATEDLNSTISAKTVINYNGAFSDFSRDQNINGANIKIEEYKNKFNKIIKKIDIKQIQNNQHIYRLFVILLDCIKTINANDYDFNKRQNNLELINNFKKLFEDCFKKIKEKLEIINYSFDNFIEDVNKIKSGKTFNLQNDIDKKIFITFIIDIALNLFEDIGIDTIFNQLLTDITSINEITARPEIFPNDKENIEQHIKKYIVCKFLNKYPEKIEYLDYFKDTFQSTNDKFFEHYIKNAKYDDLQYFITNIEYFPEISNLFFKNINITDDKLNYKTTYFIEFFINKNEILNKFLEDLKNKDDNIIEKIFEIILENISKVENFDYTIFNNLLTEKDFYKKILIQSALNNNNIGLQKYLINRIKNKIITNEYFTNIEQNKLFWLIANNKEELNDEIGIESIDNIIEYNKQFSQKHKNKNLYLYLLYTINNFDDKNINKQIKTIIIATQNREDFIKILYNNSKYISSEKLFKIIKIFKIKNRELLKIYAQNNNPEKITKNSLNKTNYKYLSNFEKVLMIKLFGFKKNKIEQKIESMDNGNFIDLINFKNFGHFIDRYNKSKENKDLYLKFFLEKIVYCNIDDGFLKKFILPVCSRHLFDSNIDFSKEDFNISKEKSENIEKFYKFYLELIKKKYLNMNKIIDTSYDPQFDELKKCLTKEKNKKKALSILNNFFENFLYKFEVLKFPEFFQENKKQFKILYQNMQKLLNNINKLVNEGNVLDQNIKDNFNKLKDYINNNILEKEEVKQFVEEIEKEERLTRRLNETNNIEIINETFKEKHCKHGKMVKGGKHLLFRYNDIKYSFEVPTQIEQQNDTINLLENIDINNVNLYEYHKGLKTKGISGIRQEIESVGLKEKVLNTIIDKLYILKIKDNQQNFDLLTDINNEFQELLENNLTSMRNLN